MNGEKMWYQSMTIQGQIVTAIGLVLAVLKSFYDLEIIGPDETTAGVSAVFTLIGIAMGVYGRLKATTTIKLN